MCILSLSAAGSPITVGMSLKLRASVRSGLCVFDRQPGDLPADVCVFVRVRVSIWICLGPIWLQQLEIAHN